MPRLFIGIKCTGQDYLKGLQLKLKGQFKRSKINWVDPENFHITLKFLGDVDEFYINSICSLLEKVAAQSDPITLLPETTGTFGSRSQPRVIWFGYREEPRLTTLQKLIEDALSPLGFKPDEKKFSPHLTLARVKYIAPGENSSEIQLKYKEPAGREFHVNAFQLFESNLHQSGPVYTIKKEFSLQKAV